MSLSPRARVTYTPMFGPARRAQVIVKVNDVGAYMVRTSEGRRIVVPASQLSEKRAPQLTSTTETKR